jgi:ribonucleotide monophosphatase NagD (HAD superfamily)
VCANPDRVVQRGDRLIVCGGALADLYEALGGRVTMAGKPYPPIYAATLAVAEDAAGRPLSRDRVLAVGDGLPTDVRGANQAGLALLFVAAGIHGAELRDAQGRVDAERAGRFLAEAGARADYVCGDLAW